MKARFLQKRGLVSLTKQAPQPGKRCRECGQIRPEVNREGICVDCLTKGGPWDTLTPGRGEEADDNF
jgi:hypothetical protein